MRVIGVLGVVMLLLLGTAAPAMAFNPQPEPPAAQANQLDAVTNTLTVIQGRVNDILSHPPDPGSPVANGAVGRLNAMSNQMIIIVNGRLGRLLPAVAPSPEQQVVDAMLGVRAGAQAIIGDIRGHAPPDDGRVADALAGILSGAQSIVAIIDDNLPPPGGEPPLGGEF